MNYLKLGNFFSILVPRTRRTSPTATKYCWNVVYLMHENSEQHTHRQHSSVERCSTRPKVSVSAHNVTGLRSELCWSAAWSAQLSNTQSAPNIRRTYNTLNKDNHITLYKSAADLGLKVFHQLYNHRRLMFGLTTSVDAQISLTSKPCILQIDT